VSRRSKCPKHSDMLVEYSETCPRCDLDDANAENKKLKEALAVYGDPVNASLTYQSRPILRSLLRILELPRSLRGNRSSNRIETIVLGKPLNTGSEYREDIVLPRKIAEAAAKVADEIEKEHAKMYQNAFDSGIQRVKIGLKCMIDRIVRIDFVTAITAGEKAMQLSDHWHKNSVFEEVLNEAVDRSYDNKVDELWGSDD